MGGGPRRSIMMRLLFQTSLLLRQLGRELKLGIFTGHYTYLSMVRRVEFLLNQSATMLVSIA